MYPDYFCHQTIKLYTGVFGSLFSNLKIHHMKKDGSYKEIKVPIYNQHSQTYFNLAKDRDREGNRFKSILPALVFKFNGEMQYDGERQTNRNLKLSNPNANIAEGTALYQYNKTPYDFGFELKIIAKNITDVYQIIEQIMPFFQPTLSVKITNNTDIQDITDINIVLNSSEGSDSYDDGDFSEARILEHTLTFTIKGYLYKPTQEAKIIKNIQINYGVECENPFDSLVISSRNLNNDTIYDSVIKTADETNDIMDFIFDSVSQLNDE